MAPEILDLNTLAPEKPLARIRWKTVEGEGEDQVVTEHDETFELLVPEEVGTLELSRITRLFTEHDELWEKDKRTKAEDKALERLANDIAQKLIPDAPPTAIAALSAIAKRTLAVRFFVGAGLATQEAMGPALVSQLTNSSLASAASTEEGPDSGSPSPDLS